MRLIDADALYDTLADKLLWLMNYGDETYLSVGNDIRNTIDAQPTAYNIEKVVEQLEEWTFNADVNIGDGTIMKHDLITSKNAIEIVKEGGAE